MSDSEDAMFKILAKSSSDSLLKKHLTQKLYDELKSKKTKFGGTLEDCIRSGYIGLFACDPDAYFVFNKIFDEVIRDYHDVSEIRHPKQNFGDLSETENLDPSGEYIISTRIRFGRNYKDMLFPATLTRKDRLLVEHVTVTALKMLVNDDLKGEYFQLKNMPKETKEQLIMNHFLYRDDNRVLRDAGVYTDWPIGRGIFHNTDKTFIVWINEEDHLRFISMQKGGNLKVVYERLVKATKLLKKTLPFTFAHHEEYGYLTFSPSNLGTACRASVHIKVPKLEAKGILKSLCKKHRLEVRGFHGEHTESVGGVYDISNSRRLGLTEYDVVLEMQKGIKAIIAAEKDA